MGQIPRSIERISSLKYFYEIKLNYIPNSGKYNDKVSNANSYQPQCFKQVL